MRRGAPPSGRAAGFTFIEMLVVIAILSLLASIVVINLDGISAPTKLRAAARQIGNQVMQLKELAALKNRPLSIEFDVENRRYRVIDAPSALDVPDPKDREEETWVGEWEEFPSGVRFEEISFSSTDVERGSSTVITFEGDGEVWPSGFVAFFRSEEGREEDGISVEVSGLTGLVAYHDGHFRAEEIRRAEDF